MHIAELKELSEGSHMEKFQNSVRSHEEYVEVKFKLWTERRTVLYLWKTRNNTAHLFECEGSTVKGLTIRKIQTDDWKRRPTDRQHEQRKSVCGNS